MPAWWRYVDPFFREVHAGDLHAVLPPRRWDDDPDLRLPPVGRKHDKPFEDGLPKPEKAPAVFVPAAPTAAPAPPPKLEPPPPASVSVGVPGVSTIVGPSIPLGPAIPVGMPPAPPAPPAAAATTALPGAHPHAGAHAPAAPPVPAPPSGAAVGGAKGRGTEGDGGGEEGSGHRVAALCVVTGDEPIVIGLSIAVQLAVSSRALILLRLVTQAKRSRKDDYFEIHSLYTNPYEHR